MPSDGVEFLDFVFRDTRATINVAEKNVQRFKHRIRELTGRSRGISMDQRLAELRRYLKGWVGKPARLRDSSRFWCLPAANESGTIIEVTFHILKLEVAQCQSPNAQKRCTKTN